eukprot:1889134-Amphidinium_carterae.1
MQQIARLLRRRCRDAVPCSHVDLEHVWEAWLGAPILMPGQTHVPICVTCCNAGVLMPMRVHSVCGSLRLGPGKKDA